MLSGLRAVELGVWVAGPSATGVMADWGADVIKVEPPAGDPFRAMFAATGYSAEIPNAPFELDNRGKRSVVLDLRNDEAREALHRLLETADVFLTNLRLEPLQRMGLLADDVLARHPRLVYALVTGHGSTGPDVHRPGYDIGVFGARAGVVHQLVPAGDAPPPLPRGLGDHFTGLAALSGILGALWQRQHTGRGQLVETSLLRSGVYALGWDLAIQQALGKVAGTVPREEAAQPTANSYRAGDGKWFWLLGVEGDRHFPLLVKATAREDLLDDERFASARSRRHNRRELIAELDRTFASRPFAEWTERFDAEDVWWSPVQSPAEVVTDPQAEAAGAWVPVEGGRYRSVATPVDFSEHPQQSVGRMPALGADTADVLGEIGYDAAAIKRLNAPRA